MTRLSKNFTVEEMACPLTGECKLQEGWIELLQALRTRCEFPFRIVAGGGCISLEFNKSIKGAAPNSFHLIGNKKYGTDTCAIDIATHTFTLTHGQRLRVYLLSTQQGSTRNEIHHRTKNTKHT